MKEIFKIVSLCIVMIFVFAGISLGKTNAMQPVKLIQPVMQEKLMREGITIKDKTGNSHYFSLKAASSNCAIKSNGKRGWWRCIRAAIREVQLEIAYWESCDDDSTMVCAWLDIQIGAYEQYLDQNCGFLGWLTLNKLPKVIDDKSIDIKPIKALQPNKSDLLVADPVSILKPQRVTGS